MMPRLALGHPSRKRLAAWLDATEAAPAVTAHVEQCERCAARLEEMATVESDDPLLDEAFGDALRTAYAPPVGIEERVLRSIDARQRLDREMNLLLGIFAIAKDAAELMLPDEPTGGDEEGNREDHE